MVLNKQKGNMYGFVTHTWNAIKGRCLHNCSYCYMKPFWKSEVHLDEKELKTDLGEGNFIFVGSSTDMFARDVSGDLICKTLANCNNYYTNTYLFQTKNPQRLFNFKKWFPKNMILGTTIETNRENDLEFAPTRSSRYAVFLIDFKEQGLKADKMITIEPIMDFDLDVMVRWMKEINPEFVNIGADSKGHNLPEPSWNKIQLLIKELEKFTKVNLKPNLERLKVIPKV